MSGVLDRMRLDGQVALVTGASHGIGEGIALAFAEAGADVALAARNQDDLERVAGLVRERGRRALVAPADMLDLSCMEPLVEPTIGRWFTLGFVASRQDVVEPVRAMIRGTSPRGYVGCCHAISTLDLTDRLGAIRVPTIVIVGEEDQGTPVAASRAIQERIPGAELVVLKSAAHLSNVEQPADGGFQAEHREVFARDEQPGARYGLAVDREVRLDVAMRCNAASGVPL